jgi:hypothetical protein
MRTEFKMLMAGFGAGAVVGLVALTHVSASINGSAGVRENRLALVAKPPIAFGDGMATPAIVTVASTADGVVEWVDPRGRLLYQANPARALTTVAKGRAIPVVMVGETNGQP